jgi:hypothetical protein
VLVCHPEDHIASDLLGRCHFNRASGRPLGYGGFDFATSDDFEVLRFAVKDDARRIRQMVSQDRVDRLIQHFLIYIRRKNPPNQLTEGENIFTSLCLSGFATAPTRANVLRHDGDDGPMAQALDRCYLFMPPTCLVGILICRAILILRTVARCSDNHGAWLKGLIFTQLTDEAFDGLVTAREGTLGHRVLPDRHPHCDQRSGPAG